MAFISPNQPFEEKGAQTTLPNDPTLSQIKSCPLSTQSRTSSRGSPDAQAATAKMIEILAAEAIKTGQPDALVAVAAQWGKPP